MTVSLGIILVVVFLVLLDCLCAWWLRRIHARRHRPIAEHSDAYWHSGMESRKRNEANGSSFR